MASVKTISLAIENWAPKGTAESYDNVGLLLGRPDAEVSRGLVALDLTPAVVKEAIDLQAQLIVTHHPPIFKPTRSITSSDFVGSMLLTLAENGIAVYSAHTNIDSAVGGVSFELASRLELNEPQFLSPSTDAVSKIVTFVPTDSALKVRDAMSLAGAGRIGRYTSCSFATQGVGTFTPQDGAQPTKGSTGILETVEETRIEMEVERPRLSQTIKALKEAHPYEEVAYDVYPITKESTRTGLGVVGNLPSPESLFEFLERTRVALNCEALRFTGSSKKPIQRVAVCGGSGGSLIPDALRAGADAFVTSDLTYHRFFDVLDSEGSTKMALIDAGHYETEAFAEELLVQRLSAAVSDVRWEATGYRTSPIGFYPM